MPFESERELSFKITIYTHSLAQVVCVLQDLVEFDQVSNDHFSMRVQYRERDKDDKLVGVVIREEDLVNSN
jgi:hypothetical protein